jgi:hypothetical protein
VTGMAWAMGPGSCRSDRASVRSPRPAARRVSPPDWPEGAQVAIGNHVFGPVGQVQQVPSMSRNIVVCASRPERGRAGGRAWRRATG